MKKIFTLICALVGFAGAANAATVDDLAVLKHSYVFVADDYTGAGSITRVKGTLFGDNHFLDVTGGSIATNKGTVNLSVADGILVTEDIAAKYGEYGEHLNSLRLKKSQDVIAMKVTAGSKVIIFYQDNNKDDRYPVFAKDASLKERFADGEKSERVSSCKRIEWTAADDGLVYVGDNNGDMFLSFIIVEANEAAGTPTVKVGAQTFEGGLWFREVTCKANDMEGFPTVVTYTTDGSTPTAASPVYTAPIKCYKETTVKFQAYMDLGDGKAVEEAIAPNADNEVTASFKFDAPTINANGATFEIVSPYEGQGAANYFSLGDGDETQGNGATLTESATVKAWTKIANGEYATFTSNPTTKDVYVLNAIKEKKTITVSGDAVLDEEATATSTTGEVYKVENGVVNVDKADFFVKTPAFGVVKNADYQIDGKEVYLQMSNTNITFLVAADDVVNVKVICSKNACKNIDAEDAAADKQVDGCTPDRSCYVNVSGTNYCAKDADGKAVCDQKLYPGVANVIEFQLKGGKTSQVQSENDVNGDGIVDKNDKEDVFTAADTYYTFQKYSGTGAILIASIEITPAGTTGIQNVKAEKAANDGVIYNLAGQKVNSGFKGIAIVNGKKVVLK